MGELREYFENNKLNLIDKWLHYFDIYEHYFIPFKGRPINFLEIGVFQGGSLLMWKDYFHNDSKIYGIDFNKDCKIFEGDNIEIHIGSQSNKIFLKEFTSNVPKFDIIIDDGGHKMKDQKISFDILFEHLNDGGIYICEDTHTSYWKNYGGGYRNSNSFIEFSKNKIDDINAWHSRDNDFKKSKYTMSVKSIHFYDSMVIFIKDNVIKPATKRTGVFMIDPGSLSEPLISKDKKGIVRKIYDFFNNVSNI